MSFKRIGDICSLDRQIISPTKGTEYTLYSFSAFDNNQIPEIVDGAYIKSAKLKVHENRILYNKLNVKFRRVWNIKNLSCVNPVCSTEFFPLKVKEGISQDFLYFNLISNSLTKTMDSHRKGTSNSQQRIDLNTLFNYQIFCPSYDTQCKIASILSSFDDKIKENNAINQNLEQQAMGIFEDLFPNILQPNSSNTVGEIITFSNGKKRPEQNGSIPVYGGNGVLAYTDSSNAENCVIIGRVGAYCGNTFLCLNKCWVSDNAIQAKARMDDSQLFVYHLLKKADLPARHIGTGQPLITQEILNMIPIMIPSSDKINQFVSISEPMYKMISKNESENKQLSDLRDALLPRLMSGELDVS